MALQNQHLAAQQQNLRTLRSVKQGQLSLLMDLARLTRNRVRMGEQAFHR
jgi:hypothetical protein